MELYRIPSASLLGVVIACWMASCGERTKTGAEQGNREQVVDSLAGQTTGGADTLGMPATVAEIRQAHAAIVTKLGEGRLDSTSFSYSCDDEKNGTVSYYSDNGQLRMVVHRYNEYDHYSAEDTYFVQDSTLFFAFLKRVAWSFTSGPEGATKDDITELRVYVVDQQPVQCLEKKFTVHSHADSNPTSEEVPSREVDCIAMNRVIEPYRALLKHQHHPTAGCLGE